LTRVDWFAFGFVALTGLIGLRKGLIASALSVTGIVAGALIGARLAPHVLDEGASSPYTPLVGLAGAAIGAVLLEMVGTVVGGRLRNRLRRPTLRTVDTAGGLVLGAAAGFAVVWVVGAVALQYPGRTDLRQGAQRSLVLQRLNELVPPARLMRALARVDPFPAITGPGAPVGPPDPQLLADPDVRRAVPSVVRVLGSACGLGVSGSGWVGAPGLVVTAAHVVAGQRDTTVEPAAGPALDAEPVHFDRKNDIAVLHVPGLDSAPLALAAPRKGAAVAILGFPERGGFDATPGRIGLTRPVLARDAYGQGPVSRTITSIRAQVRHGNSGGPAVDGNGRVQTTIFASRPGGELGFGVPSEIVRRALARARAGRPVSTGGCA
jgi:S1-C subfamily serine protease